MPINPYQHPYPSPKEDAISFLATAGTFFLLVFLGALNLALGRWEFFVPLGITAVVALVLIFTMNVVDDLDEGDAPNT